MKQLITILLVALVAFSSQADVCTVTLTGDWTNSSLRIKEPTTGVDTTITGTSDVWFRGTGNAVFLYSGINGTNTFSYDCANQQFTSPTLTDGDVYISAGVLPVELSFFRGEVVNNSTVLKWQTESEINNSHFEVEKSTDGLEFEKIGFVQGNGTTLETHDYIFIDYNTETAYYRLKQVDFDGGFEYSDVVFVEAISEVETSILGNVTSNELQIVGSGQAYIVNSFGQVVKQLQLTESNIVTVDVSTFAKGIYFVKLKNETLRFVKI